MCGNNVSGWMGVVSVWQQWQCVDGRSRGVAIMTMDGWAWSGCRHANVLVGLDGCMATLAMGG